SYGLATSWCKGIPRILFPWGGDIFNYVESSPVVNWMTTQALRNVDLIVPSSITAAEYIPNRFGVDRSRIEAVSWGVDLELFRPASAEQRAVILNRYRIPDDSRVIVNARRFKTLWGAMEALEACMAVARDHPDVYCIFPGGSGTQAAMEAANARIIEAGLQSQFTLLTENIPLSDYADILSVADIFLSLLGRGDMRSSSVLQGAACGGTPVIVDSPEYRMMTTQGFAAEFVPEGDVDALTTTIERLLSSEHDRRRIRAANQSYISTHEDQDRQMTHLLNLIHEVRTRYHH
ncbi:MAG: glycosyltransferase family 4 protein, partial [Rhodopirellula sp.]|nr:glycosyltransferase family 4 protein [Rhodopirellula sp.]